MAAKQHCLLPAGRQPAARHAVLEAGGRRQRAAARAAAGGGKAAAPPVTLTLPCSTSMAMPQAALVIGSAADADVQLEGSNVAAQHARLEWRGGRLFCTATSGDPDILLAPTHCWLDGVELRPGVMSCSAACWRCPWASCVAPALPCPIIPDYPWRWTGRRLQVSYMVAPGARIAVGSQDTCLTCKFEEGGSSAMTEMLMKVGWLASVMRGWGCRAPPAVHAPGLRLEQGAGAGLRSWHGSSPW